MLNVLLCCYVRHPPLSIRLQPNRPLDKPIDLETDSILRLTFTTPTPVPKYAHLEFKDTNTGIVGGKSWIYEIPVKADGRGRFDLVSFRGLAVECGGGRGGEFWWWWWCLGMGRGGGLVGFGGGGAWWSWWLVEGVDSSTSIGDSSEARSYSRFSHRKP
jgi:hypothetical protein